MSGLYTHHHGMHGEANPVEECIYRATVADLVAALIAEGGKMLDAEPRVGYELPPGRYLVFPIPVESAEAKETP